MRAHPVSMSWAELRVEELALTGRVEILVEDLYLFHDLRPDRKDQLPLEIVNRAAGRHAGFLARYLTLRDLKGETLPLEVELADPVGLEGEAGIPMTDLMNHSVVYRVSSSLSSPLEYLTVQQDFGGSRFPFPAVMELTVWKDGVRVVSPRSLEREVPFSCALDGEVYGERSESGKREDKAMGRPSSDPFGLSSYGSIYAFLYITRREIRLEILVPLVTLEEWLKLERDREMFLEVEEQDRARDSLKDFFRTRNPLTVDGERGSPESVEIRFFGLDSRDLAGVSEPKRLSAVSARVGAILRVPLESPPRVVEMTWTLFRDLVPRARITAFPFGSGESQLLTRGKPTYRWTAGELSREDGEESPTAVVRSLPPRVFVFPLVGLSLFSLGILGFVWGRSRATRNRFGLAFGGASIGLGLVVSLLRIGGVEIHRPGPGQLGSADADRILGGLLSRAYRASEGRRAESAYDALALVAERHLLEKLYLSLASGWTLEEEEGGPVARVGKVDLLGTGIPRTLDRPRFRRGAFRVPCRWAVEGTVEHWGHLHDRRREYVAELAVTVDEERIWRLEAIDILDEQRSDVRTRLRSLEAPR